MKVKKKYFETVSKIYDGYMEFMILFNKEPLWEYQWHEAVEDWEALMRKCFPEMCDK